MMKAKRKPAAPRLGLLLSAMAIPAMLMAPLPAVAGSRHHHYDYRYDYHHSRNRHHRHHGGSSDLAVGLLGAGVGLIIGSAIASQPRSRDRVIVRERVVTTSNPYGYNEWRNPDAGYGYNRGDGYGYNPGNGWYQPVSQPVRAPAPASSCLQEREYQTTVTVGNEEVDAYGTACLQPDGSWKFGTPTPVPY